MRIFFISLLFFVGLFARINVVVSIPPQEYFTKAIAGGLANIEVMVKPGNSPHSYEPKPSQMKAINSAKLYLAIGVEFEKAWLPRFASQNKGMMIVDISRGIQKIPMQSHEHEDEHNHGSKKDHHTGLDPHVWTSVSNARILAKNTADALIEVDPEHKKEYQKNLHNFESYLDEFDAEIKKTLSNVPKNSAFMVFHPSWGYFSKEYGLKQIAVEVEGKAPKPKQLIELIKKAKKLNVKAIFVQPEFSDKSAKLLAKELNIPVLKISPLNSFWNETLLELARAIAQKDFKKQN